jgi:predicted DNA-binding mobile mystery protein A
MDKYTNLKVNQLDESLKNLRNLEVPLKGWIYKVRNTLDITFSYIANRLNTSPQVIKKFEQNEAEGSITINSLRKVAEAMDCNLVYAFVPKDGSFENLIDNKTDRVSEYIISRTSNSMNLEMQKLNKSAISKQKKQMKHDLVKDNLKNLWKYEI